MSMISCLDIINCHLFFSLMAVASLNLAILFKNNNEIRFCQKIPNTAVPKEVICF